MASEVILKLLNSTVSSHFHIVCVIEFGRKNRIIVLVLKCRNINIMGKYRIDAEVRLSNCFYLDLSNVNTFNALEYMHSLTTRFPFFFACYKRNF